MKKLIILSTLALIGVLASCAEHKPDPVVEYKVVVYFENGNIDTLTEIDRYNDYPKMNVYDGVSRLTIGYKTTAVYITNFKILSKRTL